MVSRSASAVASVLLSTMEEMKEEQEKKDKLLETKKEKAVVGQIPAGDKKEKEVPTVREKSSKEEKEKGGKRLITPEKPRADKKPKAISANPPREVLASLTNRFYSLLTFPQLNLLHSPRKTTAPTATLSKPSTDQPPSIR